MRSLQVALLCLVAAHAAYAYHHGIARMFATTLCTSGNNCDPTAARGMVYFDQDDTGNVLVNVSFWGLSPNSVHGIHVHTYGDLSSANSTRTGAHFNPNGGTHGCPPTVGRENGDLGSITADASGNAFAEILIEPGMLQLMFLPSDATATGMNILGRGVVLHSVTDPCSGTAYGARILQGTIGVANNGTAATSFSTIHSAASINTLSAKLYDTSLAAFGQVWMRVSPNDASKVQVYLRASGLIPGSVHGIHVHQYGDHSLASAANAGGHWNPWGVPHNMPYVTPMRHVGDLGNVVATASGEIFHLADYDTLVLAGADFSNVIGLGFVVHSWPDLGAFNAANGASGPRQAMGVLAIAFDANFPSTFEKAPMHAGFARMYPTVEDGTNTADGWVKVSHGDDNQAVIQYSFMGLPPNKALALHIHETGDLTPATPPGNNAGGHYNPWGFPHDCYNRTSYRHVGDIGTMPPTDANGAVSGTFYRDWIALAGTNSTIGRSFMVHAGADDCSTQPTGGAGGRIAHGVIGLVGNAANAAINPGVYPIAPFTVLNAKISFTSKSPYATPVTGWVWFATNPTDSTQTLVYVDVRGLPPNTNHGFHVHQWGDWTGYKNASTQAGLPDGTAAGGHWNPNNANHALPSESPNRHAGDMGNVFADANGNVQTILTTQTNNLMPLKDLIGRGVVVHALNDQGQSSQPTGGAGDRVAMGVIGITKQPFPILSSTGSNAPNTTSTGGGCLSVDGNCTNGASSAVPVSFFAVVFAILAATKFAQL